MRTLEEIRTDPRVTVRNRPEPSSLGSCVIYWMQRAQRTLDNPALEIAVEVANQLRKPLVVFFALNPHFPGANLRHFTFLMDGLREIPAQLAKRRIGFVLRVQSECDVAGFCREARPCLVIGDENPLRHPETLRLRLAADLKVAFWTVDADVIVPSKLIPKAQFAARTIRPRLRAHLDLFLQPLPRNPVRVAWKLPRTIRSLHPSRDLFNDLSIDRTIGSVSTFEAGTTAGKRQLQRFLRQGLSGYAKNRNHPELPGTSRLSPYLHFGHLGPLTLALAAKSASAPRVDRDAFLEELVVRRELSVNFVRTNPHYDSIESCEPWAKRTLDRHAQDLRPYRYSGTQLENAETHDPLWNGAQQQMVHGGWMHGYLRMYWAKKILEWTSTPEEAFDIAVRLNDRYELDGRDPNGYAGIAWAIAGKHDRAWGPERPVFGMVRYMSFASTSRKFNYRKFLAQVGNLISS